MVKIVFITDVHFCAKNGNKMVFESMMEFFELQFFPYLVEHNVKNVISLGDVFDTRTTIDTFILQELKNRFFGWFEKNGIFFDTLTGNHDQTLRNTNSHSIFKSIFNEYTYCRYYDEPSKLKIGNYVFGMIPWINDTDNINIPSGCDILCMHPEFNGYSMVRGIECKNRLNIEEYSKYKMLLCGHFHIQKLPYIGNPFQKDWSDFGEKKGFWTLGENFDLEFIPNTISPRFIKILYSEGEFRVAGDGDIRVVTEEEAIRLAKENYVKIIIQVCKKQKVFGKFYESMRLASKDNYKIELIDATDIMEECNTVELERNIQQGSSTIETINGYVDGLCFDSEIEKDRMDRIFASLYQEVMFQSELPLP